MTYAPARRLRCVNVLHRALLRRGMGLTQLRVLSVRGRSSGELYSTPVLPVDAAGRRWLVAVSDAAHWVHNARADRWAVLARGRQVEIVQLVELHPDDAPPIVEEFKRRLRAQRLARLCSLGALPGAFNGERSAHPVFEVVSGAPLLGAGR
jgi:hypothetical protein